MDGSEKGYGKLSECAKSYPPMIAAYRDGYRQFVASGYDIPVGDKAVPGIDRAPSKALTAAVEAMTKEIDDSNEPIEEHTGTAWMITLVVLVIALITGCSLFVWFIDKKMLYPLNQVTEVSRRISSGDFTTEIKVESQD